MKLDTWTSSPLAEVAEIVGGGTPQRSNTAFFGADIDWVTPSDLPPIGEVRLLGPVAEALSRQGLKSSSAKKLPPGSVLYSSRASIGKIAVANRPCCTNQGFANFIPYPDKVDAWYLAFYLAAVRSDILALAGHTTFKEVSRGKLREFPIRYPALAEQRRIVERIRECFDRIDEIRTLRATTRADTRRLQAAMFHDFILKGAEESKWPTIALGEITVSAKYGTSAKAHSEVVGVPVLRMGNIVDGVLDFSDLKYINVPPADRNKYTLRPGDILVNRTNSLELVGKAATFEREDGDWVYASYLICLRVNQSRVIPQYVTAVINSNIGRDYVLRTARRAIGMVNINAKEIARFPIPLPSLREQEAVVSKLAEVRAATQQIRSSLSLQDVDDLTSAVLRQAFAGEL